LDKLERIVKLNVIFFSSKTFLNKEVSAALRKKADVHTLIVDIPVLPPSAAAETIFEQLKNYLPAIVVSLNDAGFDQIGILGKRIAETGSFVLNWYYDDPLYEHVFYKRIINSLDRRLDFVSEDSFVPLLAARGHDAHFLPLATDPAYFNIEAPLQDQTYDISFVGNSSLEFMDSVINEDAQKELDKFKSLLGRIKEMYYRNPRENLREYLQSHSEEWENTISMDREKFVFAMVWMVGYLYRRDFIVDLANTYRDRFMCFGDLYWTNFIGKSQVSADAMYYKNLCSYYRSSKINININRIQTHTSFTQRVFDCKASGAFLLTDRRLLNSRYFVTEGAGRELVEYDSLTHCKQLIDYYLVHDDERRAIALAGRDKVLALHTYDNRIEEMLSTARKKWGFF
jgi:spore maturation protein CgeB